MHPDQIAMMCGANDNHWVDLGVCDNTERRLVPLNKNKLVSADAAIASDLSKLKSISSLKAEQRITMAAFFNYFVFVL